jgi:chorismate synthase
MGCIKLYSPSKICLSPEMSAHAMKRRRSGANPMTTTRNVLDNTSRAGTHDAGIIKCFVCEDSSGGCVSINITGLFVSAFGAK